MLRLEGKTYQEISQASSISRQRVQQLLSPPCSIRKFIFQKYQYKCQDCGIAVGRSGHIHHDGENGEDYNDIANLMLLCPSCHRKKHRTVVHFCKHCGQSINSQQTYCSDSCMKQHYRLSLACSYCGKNFEGLKSAIKARKTRNNSGMFFCSKTCQGKWLADKHGFAIHPENATYNKTPHRVEEGEVDV